MLTKLIELLEKYAKEHPNATVYFGNEDGSSDGRPVFLIGEDTIDGKNICLFKLGVKDLDRMFLESKLYN